MLLFDMIPDRSPLVFLNTLIKVSACVSDKICIAQIALKMIHNALLINDGGRLLFFCFDLRSDLSACVQGQISVPILWISSPSCRPTELADLWSLNGNTILTGPLLSSRVRSKLGSPETSFETKSHMVDCRSWTGY